ncbi:hypothetical protein DC522_24895 [Microvirga sp. KLBC 81]|nr:hypothetical protein DC522_24895 [Microvirga sp. KLBC 81]
MLDNTKTIMSFANRIAGIRLEHGQLTSVCGTIYAAMDRFDGTGFEAAQKVCRASAPQGRL